MPDDFGPEFWEEQYRDHPSGHPGGPNPHLVAEVADLTPGTALDAGCGEGADAIWLATRGWRVTAIDIVASALVHAREHAHVLGADVAARIGWVQADVTTWTPMERFDLVTSHYVHTPGPRQVLFGRLAALVAPAGTLLVVGHDPQDHATQDEHSPSPGSHSTTDEVTASLDPEKWDVVVAETRTRRETHADGRQRLASDSVVRARRRAL